MRKRGFDIDAYVCVGDKNVKTSGNQMRDNDGAFVFAEYDSATKKVTLRVTLLITKRRRVKVQINGR